MTTLLKVEKITKRFGEFYANNEISFEVKKGEVLAILGENGAGKTTLMNILFGHYTPDAGSVQFEGSTIEFGNTANAIKLGIGMVHQHFTLAENLTVLEDDNNNKIKISIVKNSEENTDYSKYKVSELKKIASERGFVGYKSLKKKDLINLLQ